MAPERDQMNDTEIEKLQTENYRLRALLIKAGIAITGALVVWDDWRMDVTVTTETAERKMQEVSEAIALELSNAG